MQKLNYFENEQGRNTLEAIMINVNKILFKYQFAVWAIGLSIGLCGLSHAATTDLSTTPLASSASTAVRPNILFTLDESGSMAWNFLPDYAGGVIYTGGTANHCKVSNTCGTGETPFQTNEYNGMAYNPRLTYNLPVNADGTTKNSQNSANTTGWTVVPIDGYGVQSASQINLTTGYPEVTYCNTGVCKKNGVHTNNPFLLRATVLTDNPPVYAFPGTLPGATLPASTLVDGVMNQGTSVSGSVFNGTLDLTVAGFTSLNLTGEAVSYSGSLVTVTYTAPTAPPLTTGDTVVVSGGSCSTGYKDTGTSHAITVVDATHFTYVSTGVAVWTNTSCTVKATKASHTAVAPKISKSGSTVTVTLSSAPTPALSSASLVTVTGAGCDAGYTVSSVPITLISSTSFSYTATNATIPTGNTTCNITQVIFTPPASPGISLSGTTVTVYRSAHGLVTGDVIQVSNGTSGICDSGYKTSGTVSITKIDNNTFSYNLPIGSVTTNSNCRIDKMTVTSTVVYTTAGTQNSNPYYFVIVPTEYCDSIYLTRCVASTVPVTLSGISYSFPAPVRYCKDDATALLPPGDAGAQILANGTINCQAKFSVGTGINLRSVRYGLFWRGDIVPTRTTYSNEYFSGTINGTGWVNPLVYSNTLVIDRSKRSDCAAAPNCTYAEEMTNFANFYAYYRTRMQMMKSAAGQAFSKLDNRYRIGFSTINQSASKYLAMAPFDVTQKTNWYAKFYAINPGNSTPLREALSTAGRYFAGKKPGAVMTDDPMEYACQQNYELITTDGYWNGTDSAVKEIDGTTTMRNYDNVDSGASKRSDGAYDGGVAGATDTLADVALYYYQLDLRNAAYGNCTGALGTDVCQDIVPMTPKDTAAGLAGTQHMTTFSLGLADGLMTYQSDYETATSGDFSKIKTGATGCTFSGAGTCNWPLPVHDSQSALDDLWHAAVNGRGTYYNARDPASLTSGLTSALSGISIKVAAAAASATSSPNITQTDRSIFSSTYRTTVWDGEVTAQLIDTSSGNVLPTIVWSAQAQLDTLVHADPTPSKVARHIYMFDSANSSGNHIKDFQYAALTATEAAYFDNKCTSILLTQCTSPAVTAQGNIGSNLVNYLRGDQSLEGTVFRVREHLLGDTVNAKPAYVKLPKYGFLDSVVPTYNTFKTAQTSRQGALYMGSNDGMLHAFNTDTGAEMWSYVPRIVMPNLYKLADTSYATLHQYYVDGSPETMDIFVDSATATANGLTAGWHSILVGGLGLGGRGFYALDVTDPANPVALWEVCSSSSLCAISDPDIGYSYGNPIITKRSTDGSWVVLVTSGYNNASPGSGAGTMYVLDAVSGVVLSKTSTGTATNPPSGLAKLSPWIDNLNSDYTTRFIYGGDLNGDLWRFDLGVLGSAAAPTVTKIATLMDGTGATQSVTTRPELGDPLNNTSNSLGGTGNPAVFVGTGRYLGTTDLSNVQIQSIYGIKDNLSTTCAAAGCYPNARNSLVHQYIYQPTATTRTTSTNAVSWSINSGWFADFQVSDSGTNLPVLPSPSPGERVNLDPLLVSGTLIVVTNVPETSACTIGGTSWLYSFDFLTGQFVSTSANQIAGVKLGNAVSVGIVVGRLPAGQLKGWVTTADGSKLNVDPVTKGTGPTERTSWRELTQ
jgi:type IV pilus assembly protein PilY1